MYEQYSVASDGKIDPIRGEAHRLKCIEGRNSVAKGHHQDAKTIMPFRGLSTLISRLNDTPPRQRRSDHVTTTDHWAAAIERTTILTANDAITFNASNETTTTSCATGERLSFANLKQRSFPAPYTMEHRTDENRIDSLNHAFFDPLSAYDTYRFKHHHKLAVYGCEQIDVATGNAPLSRQIEIFAANHFTVDGQAECCRMKRNQNRKQNKSSSALEIGANRGRIK
ncbi:MAG: hypothetical protein AAF720_13730 [Pseudomonadota bacterium]